MKLIMESWKRYLNETVPDHSSELVRLRLSRIDPERLEGGGGYVATLGDDIRPKTWNINNGVLAAVDEEGDHWFLRPHAEDHQDKIEIALQGLERMGYQQSQNVPVPAWRNYCKSQPPAQSKSSTRNSFIESFIARQNNSRK